MTYARGAGGVRAGPATHATCTLITICQNPRCRARATRRAPRRAASLRARKLLKNGWPPHITDRLHLRPLDHKRHAKSTPRDGPWPAEDEGCSAKKAGVRVSCWAIVSFFFVLKTSKPVIFSWIGLLNFIVFCISTADMSAIICLLFV